MPLLNFCDFPNKLNMASKPQNLWNPERFLLSIQNSSDATGISNSLLHMFDTFTVRVAAVNSSLVVETYFTGDTLDFPKMRQ